MKPTAGYAKPRRSATPRTAIPGKTRLNLQRLPKPDPRDETETGPKSNFWKWVLLVTLFHLIVIGLVYYIYESAPAPKPPDQFISLLPQGDTVKGTPGAQKAHKLGPTTSAAMIKHTAAPPPPSSAAAVKPISPPKPITPPPVLRPEPSSIAALDKPTPPKPPKVKVDLHLADAPPTTENKPVPKPKHHAKKPAEKPADDDDTDSDHQSAGLSKEEIAAILGDKKDDAGVKNAVKSGTSGSANAHPNSFADFYAAIRDQVMSQWESPNLTDETAVNPIVEIHVEKDGRVPPESVHLVQSSGNATYDDSALTAAKSLGYLHEPLPDGCPPDIPITFKLTR